MSRKNAIHTIFPYKEGGVWMFDDKGIGVEKEAFVSGADTMIEVLTKNIPRAQKGFVLQFSSNYFPDSQIVLERKPNQRLDGSLGTWYTGMGMDGWLCSVLNLFFKKSPKHLYVSVKRKP